MTGLTKAEVTRWVQQIYSDLKKRQYDAEVARDGFAGVAHDAAERMVGQSHAFEEAACMVRDRFAAHYIVVEEDD